MPGLASRDRRHEGHAGHAATLREGASSITLGSQEIQLLDAARRADAPRCAPTYRFMAGEPMNAAMKMLSGWSSPKSRSYVADAKARIAW